MYKNGDHVRFGERMCAPFLAISTVCNVSSLTSLVQQFMATYSVDIEHLLTFSTLCLHYTSHSLCERWIKITQSEDSKTEIIYIICPSLRVLYTVPQQELEPHSLEPGQ